jgi:signal transduction histidine kinase
VEYGKRFTQRLAIIVALQLVFVVLASLGMWLGFEKIFTDDKLLHAALWTIGIGALITFSTYSIVKSSYKPLKTLADAIVFAGHSSRGGVPPNTDNLKIGREMIAALAMQVYDLASMSAQSQGLSGGDTNHEVVAQAPAVTMFDHIGLPIFGIDPKQNLTLINRPACDYLGIKLDDALGKPFYDVVKLSFESEETFENWLKDKQANAVNGTRVWERARTTDPDGNAIKQFDLVASFSKDNNSGAETMLVLYDRTDKYKHDDQEINFVALAVHELRTPLTILKGYIEVFEEEIGPTLNPELSGFMHKMQASAQQLTAFVGNILNVARVEENQLVLKLQEYSWDEIIKTAVDDLALRAKVLGKHIELNIADNLPTVAVDRISIHEVINNLVDNALKYSGDTDKIVISSTFNGEGMVETSVQDFGIGIPTAIMPDLFQKFYRSHKSRVQVHGTGLGLYLCNAVVSAHDGNIWVRSKEGEGSIFSFTLQPYDKIKHEKANGEDGIMRGAHGWIKNHTLNRQ